MATAVCERAAQAAPNKIFRVCSTAWLRGTFVRYRNRCGRSAHCHYLCPSAVHDPARQEPRRTKFALPNLGSLFASIRGSRFG